MKLDQLAYFLEAARLESVGKAARAVGISPSAISSSVGALEEELGCALFARQKQRIYLTPEGRALMRRAAGILQDVRSLKADLAAPDLAFEGRYTLACARILATTAVGTTWADFQAAHPRLSVELLTLRSAEIVAKAASAEIDLGVCLDPSAHPEVESRTVGGGRYSVVVRTGHPLRALAPRALVRALAAFPACMPRAAHPGLERLGVRPRVDFVYDSYDAVLHRIRRSDAWALYPAFLSTEPRKDVAFLALPKGEIAVAVVAVWPRRRPLNRALLRYVETLEERLTTSKRER